MNDRLARYDEVVAQAIDYLYEEWAVRLALVIFVLYVAPLSEWRAYVIVPLTTVLLPVLVGAFILFCHRQGVFRWLYEKVVAILDATYVAALLGLERIEQSKIGQFFLRLALCNLLFIPYWFYQHVDLFRLGREFCALVVTFVTALTDPIAIMRSVDAVLQSLSLLRWMSWVRTEYVAEAVKRIDAGHTGVLFVVGIVTFFLFVVGLCAYVLCNCAAWGGACVEIRQDDEVDEVECHLEQASEDL